MSELLSLEDVLNGKEPEYEAEEAKETDQTTGDDPEAVETPEPEKKTEDDQNDAGKKPEADATPESEETESKKDEEPWTKTAVLDERRKRQELERKLEDLQRQLETKGTEGNEGKKTPDFFEDPDALYRYMAERDAETSLITRVDISTALLKDQHEDYDEMESLFVDLCEETPQLYKDMVSHPLPAKFAYETAKKHQEYKEMQDLPSYKQKLKAELEAEIRASLKKEQELEQSKKDAKRAAVETPSLANTRSAKASDTVVDLSLTDIFPS